MASNGQRFDDLLNIVDSLSVEEKTILVKRLLPGMSVTFGNNQLSGSIVVQINAMDREVLADLLEAIANRIKHDY